MQRQALWRGGLVRDLAVLALLLVLCLLFFWRILTPNDLDRGSFRQGDFYDQFYAFASFEHDELLQGRLPLWNPYTYSGHPFLADVQSAVFYPLSLLTVLLSAAWGFSAFALELEAIAHVFLAGAFTYLFAKRLLRSRAGALVAAVTFAFGGYLTSYPPLQLAILETVVWLPLVLLFLDLGIAELAGQRCLAFLYLVLAGGVLGIAILAGHPQTAMYVVYLSLLYFLFRIWWVKRQGVGQISGWLAVAGLATYLLVGLGLAAVQILPSWEFMRLSSRPELGYQELSGGFAYLDFLQILLPHSTGFWSPLYIGIFPLLLALFALAVLVWGKALGMGSEQRPRVRRWRADIAFWAIVAGIALMLAVGDDSFLYSLFYLGVPGFGLFRGQERAALLFGFSLSLLAGYGFAASILIAKEAKSREKGYRLFLKLLAGLGLLVAVLAILFFIGRSSPDASPGGPMDAMLGLAVFVALMLTGSLIWLVVWNQKPEKRFLWTSLALALIVLDLFTVNARPNVQKRKIENQHAATGLIRELQAQPGTFRVHNEFRLPGNYGDVHGLEDTWGASPLRLASYERFMEQVPQQRAWELLGVGYVVTWLEDLDEPAQVVYQEPAKKGEVNYLHQLDGERPRTWVVYQVETVSGEEAVLDRVSQPDFDPYTVAVLTEPLVSELAGNNFEARLVEQSPSYLAVDVVQDGNGLLVLSEIDYPGWQASVDGRPAPILRADGILRAVEVPAGQHRIEMAFKPWTVGLGLAISGLVLLGILIYGIYCMVRCGRKS